MTVRVSLDLTSAVPPFEQVRGQLASLIVSGTLPKGTRLPSVRDLAADLGVAVGTVARAYRELESLGLVTSRRGRGTVVSAEEQTHPDDVRACVADLVRLARAAGISDAEILELVRGSLLSGQ